MSLLHLLTPPPQHTSPITPHCHKVYTYIFAPCQSHGTKYSVVTIPYHLELIPILPYFHTPRPVIVQFYSLFLPAAALESAWAQEFSDDVDKEAGDWLVARGLKLVVVLVPGLPCTC